MSEPDLAREIVSDLLHSTLLAVACEHNNNSDRLSLIQIGTTQQVILFDAFPGILLELAPLFSASSVLKVFHNCKNDCKLLEKAGIYVEKIIDTQLMYVRYRQADQLHNDTQG